MRRLVPVVPALLLAGCIPNATPPRATRPARPAATPAPLPPPAHVQVPLSGDWRDWPLTPGDWQYHETANGSVASFGVAGGPPVLTMRCDRRAGDVLLSQPHVTRPADAMTITTSSVTRTIAATYDSGTGALTARIKASDSLLDAMGFSRGRFVVAAPSLATLVVPAWPEVLRVTEDCR